MEIINMAKKKKALGADPLSWLEENESAQSPESVPDADMETRVNLDDDLTIQNVSKRREDLLAIQSQEVTVNAKNISVIDTAGIQLLLSFYQSRKQQDKVTHWENVSPVLRELAELLDLDNQLELAS